MLGRKTVERKVTGPIKTAANLALAAVVIAITALVLVVMSFA